MNTSLHELVVGARLLADSGARTILGITGPPGSGKSTLAAALASALAPDASLVGMDGFHLANSELERLGVRDRKGAPDTFDAAGYAALLRRLRADDEAVVWAPLFDRSIEESIAGAVPVPREVPLVITEGNYLLLDTDGWQHVQGFLDECWYVDLDDRTRIRRLTARHLSYGKSRSDALARATGSDERNARVVAATRDRATRHVKL